jgi:hypothetical protein
MEFCSLWALINECMCVCVRACMHDVKDLKEVDSYVCICVRTHTHTHTHTHMYIHTKLCASSVLLPAVFYRSNNIIGSVDKHTVKCKPTVLTRVTSLFHISCDAQACSSSTDASNKPFQTCLSPFSLHPAYYWSLGHHARALQALHQVHPSHSALFPTLHYIQSSHTNTVPI